jgi:hypothetical protein
MGLSSLTCGGRSGITAQPLPARWAERGGGGMLAEGPGQAAESAATAGRAWPAFQPADGGHTHSGPVGQFLL